jgi:hypothetical protein
VPHRSLSRPEVQVNGSSLNDQWPFTPWPDDHPLSSSRWVLSDLDRWFLQLPTSVQSLLEVNRVVWPQHHDDGPLTRGSASYNDHQQGIVDRVREEWRRIYLGNVVECRRENRDLMIWKPRVTNANFVVTDHDLGMVSPPRDRLGRLAIAIKFNCPTCDRIMIWRNCSFEQSTVHEHGRFRCSLDLQRIPPPQ